MKQQKRKILTLALASVLGAATLGGGVMSAMADTTTDAPAPYTVSVGDVFTTSSATSDATGSFVSFNVKNNGTVTLAQRSLAWKWFAKNEQDVVEANYLNFELTFADANFEEISVILETASVTANKENKAVNVLKFVNVGGTVYASVNPAEDADPTLGVAVEVLPEGTTEKTIAVSVDEAFADTDDDTYGKYVVRVDDRADKTVGEPKRIGLFENVGSTYGKYASSTSSNPLTPFKLKATLPESTDANAPTTTVVRLKSLNGQSFALENSKITDNANPVLVVNNEVTSYMLGTSISVSDEFNYIDVLDKTVTKTVKYAQYNPTVADADMEYKDLTSSIYFSDTQYEEAGVKKTVYGVYGEEYLSVEFKLSDEYNKDVVYELAWYAQDSVKVGNSAKDYVVLDRNTDGATYTFIDKTNGSNEYTADAEDKLAAYQELVTEAAKDLKANSNTNFYLPSMVGLIADNGGYTNLKFTISYKSTNSTSASTRSSLTASNLQFPVSKSGDYGFKVFAVDKAGNSMMYYNEDGDLVSVSTSNVWDIEEIPFFTFSIPEPSLSVDDNETKDTDRKDTVALGETYDDFDLKLLGDHASSATKATKLYRIDTEKFVKKFGKSLATNKLSSIKYAEILDVSSEDYAAATDYEKLYFESYVKLVAKALDVNANELLTANVFVEIAPYDSNITEEDHAEEYAKNNVYKWNEDNQTFVAQNESDVYFIFALYTASELDFSMVCGYKVITVDAEDDVLPGETDWLKNNVVSVILFGIAGLMLILIVVVLLIKPSDETLEDVEAKAAKKASKSKEEDNE